MRQWVLVAMMGVALTLAPIAASSERAATKTTAQASLLNVWLDLQLTAIMSQKANPREFAAEVVRIAAQLHQPKPVIRQGRAKEELRRYPVGVVIVKTNAPPQTLILWARDANDHVWQLTDDPRGRLTVVELKQPISPLAA